MRKSIIVFGVLALLAVPATASAQGNAGQDEYTEGVPGGGGEKPPDSGTAGGSGGGSLPPGTEQQLLALGADGEAAAALARANGPDQGTDQDKKAPDGSASGQDSGSGLERGDSGGGIGNVVADVVGGSDDEGGAGIVLPLILGASLLAAIGFLIARRSSGTPAGPA